MGSIPVRGTKILQAEQCIKKRERERTRKKKKEKKLITTKRDGGA